MTTKRKHIKKPEWLKINNSSTQHYSDVSQLVKKHCLHTICSSGRCPNQGECWSRGTATFMILGEVCSRSCKFCNTKSGKGDTPNPNEPQDLANSIQIMKLKHAVITCVTRDDLKDQGAAHWVQTIQAIRATNPDTTIEVLVPDFQGNKELLQQVIDAKPDILGHNIETVRRLTNEIRSVATYDTSMQVLKQMAQSGIPTKSSIMLGLGETEEEILETMDDLLQQGVEIFTLGQYLQPTSKHHPVAAYIHPDKFAEYKEVGLKKGFASVESGPLVRSSYHAEKHLQKKLH